MRALLRGTIAAVALSLAPLAVVTTTASSAQAADTVDTSTTFASDLRKRGEYNATFIVSGEVKVPGTDDSILAGVSYLQRQAPGSKKWSNVAKDESPGFSYFPDYDKYKSNAKFRIYYTGGTYGAGGSSEWVYNPSVSKVIKMKVYRTFEGKDVSKQQPTVSVKFSPKFGNKKILVQKKKGKKKYQTFKRVKTNKKGKARISAPGSGNGIVYRLVAPGNKQFIATKGFFTAYRYRSLARPAR